MLLSGLRLPVWTTPKAPNSSGILSTVRVVRHPAGTRGKEHGVKWRGLVPCLSKMFQYLFDEHLDVVRVEANNLWCCSHHQPDKCWVQDDVSKATFLGFELGVLPPYGWIENAVKLKKVCM